MHVFVREKVTGCEDLEFIWWEQDACQRPGLLELASP